MNDEPVWLWQDGASIDKQIRNDAAKQINADHYTQPRH